MSLSAYEGLPFSDMILAGYMHAQFSMGQEVDFLLRIIVACLCGGFIGIERARRLKEAGMRTHVVVCFAAALMIIVSKYGFADLTTLDGINYYGTRGADPSRIAAQVVSGVSFLGAGAIFKSGSTIKGLTTAAGLWATAGIGLAIGSGMYLLGVASTALLIAMQILMHKIKPTGESMTSHQMEFTIGVGREFRREFNAYLEEQRVQVMESEITDTEDGFLSYKLTLKMPHGTIQRLDDFLHSHGNVRTVSYSNIT